MLPILKYGKGLPIRCFTGEAVSTRSGELSCGRAIHAVSASYYDHSYDEFVDLVYKAYASAFQQASMYILCIYIGILHSFWWHLPRTMFTTRSHFNRVTSNLRSSHGIFEGDLLCNVYARRERGDAWNLRCVAVRIVLDRCCKRCKLKVKLCVKKWVLHN